MQTQLLNLKSNTLLLAKANYNSNNTITSMLLPHQLYPIIPRKVQEWSASDVREWFKANSIQIKSTFQFEEERFDGLALIDTTPNYLVNKCGITSKIVMKKILEWIQQEKDEYNEYVQGQAFQLQEIITQKCISQLEIYETSDQKDIQNTPKSEITIKPIQKHQESIIPLDEVKKWNKKRKSIAIDKRQQHFIFLKQLQLNSNKNKSQNQNSSNVRFVQSSYEITESKLLFSYTYNHQQIRRMELKGNGDIGRRKQCEILVEQESVSRQHAQILKIGSQFFLRDNNSSYGTFVQIGTDKRKPLQEGDVLNFEDEYMEILKIKITNSKGMRSFDLKVKMFKSKESVINFYKKVVVLIGKKDRDININYPNIAANHAKIVLENDNRLYLVKEQGQAFIKLKKQQLYKLQLEQQCIMLGLQMVEVKLIKERRPITNFSQLSLQKSEFVSESPIF